MILKEDEPLKIVRDSITSVLPHTDGAYIVVTYGKEVPTGKNPLVKMLKEMDCEVSFFKWTDDFSEARNFAMNQVPKGENIYLYWQDADDKLRGAEKLKEITKMAHINQWAAVFFDYWYKVDFDETGEITNILVKHKRERIIRNDDTFKWIGMLHETLIEQRVENVKKVSMNDCVVIHANTDDDRADKNIERNIRILEKQTIDDGGKDPRTLVYLARAYFDKGKIEKPGVERQSWWDQALRLFHTYLEGKGVPGEKNYIAPSGWPEERAIAWSHIGEMAVVQKAPKIAVEAFQNAIEESPLYPQHYVNLAMAYTLTNTKGDIEKAKHWLTLATSFDSPETTLITTPKDMKTRALETDFYIQLREGKFEEAVVDLEKLIQLLPQDKALKERLKSTREAMEANKAAQSIVYLGKYMEANKVGKKNLEYLTRAIPESMANEKFVSEMRHRFLPPRTWKDNEIAILCGAGVEPWTPDSVKTGLGGSEEAVVYLSQELKKLGWKVTVFAAPGEKAGKFNGIEYREYHEININDNFNALILWRNIGFVDLNPKAKFKMVWMHDVPNNADFTEERVNKVNKIAVLSEYHESLLRYQKKDGTYEKIPKKKIFLTENGTFNLKPPSKKNKRDQYKMIYASSPDRGLVHLLKMWPTIKKEVPKATLDVYYGFNTFDVLYADNPAMMKWKAGIMGMLKQDGIKYHGRIGHEELHKAMEGCGVWAYPTDFTEISCITAMKAQILGAIPVTTTLAALNETVKNGIKIDADITEKDVRKEYVESLVELLKDKKKQEEIREPMMKWAKDFYTWERVAFNWDKLFRVYLQNPEMLKRKDL